MLRAMIDTPDDKVVKKWTFTFDRVNSIITTETGGVGMRGMRGRWQGKCKVIDRSNKF